VPPPLLLVGRQWPPELQVSPVPQKAEDPGVHDLTHVPPVGVGAQTTSSNAPAPQSAFVVHERVQTPVEASLPLAQDSWVLASSQSAWLVHPPPTWLTAPGMHTLTDWLAPRPSESTVGLQKNPGAQSRTVEQRSRQMIRPSLNCAPKDPRGHCPSSASARHCFDTSG
jgi:hypothetical protein